MQNWFGYSDPAIEEALYETTILNFRRLLEKHELAGGILAVINGYLGDRGLSLRQSTIVDATLINAPSSTKNKDGKRDPEMHRPLLNLMRDRLLGSAVIHCDETRLQVLKEPGREPSSQSWMWVQTAGPPNRPVILFDYSSSRAQDVPLRLLAGYLMTDDYAAYNAVAAQASVERLVCWAHMRRKFVEAQKVQPKGKTGRADVALGLINKLYGIERELKEAVTITNASLAASSTAT